MKFIIYIFFILIMSGCKISGEMNNCKDYFSINAKGISPSLYTIKLTQLDESAIEVISKDSRSTSYTETIDGYTILRIRSEINEYACYVINGKLLPCGVNAKNTVKKNI